MLIAQNLFAGKGMAMLNKSKIMKRAWELFRGTYNFPAIPLTSIGRHCFCGCLKQAWREAKEAARIAAIPQADKQKQITSIRNQMELTKYSSFRTNQSQRIVSLQSQLTNLAA